MAPPPAGVRPFGLSALAILAVIGGVLGLLEGLGLLKFGNPGTVTGSMTVGA